MGEAIRSYALISRVWVRAGAQYRLNMALLTIASVVSAAGEIGGVLVVYSQVHQLGGFDRADVLLLAGSSGASLALADLLVGNVQNLGEKIRDGSFDTMLIRPVSPLVQVAAEAFAVRRTGRLLASLTVLAVGCAQLQTDWTPARAAAVPLTVLGGALIIGCAFVLGGAFQVVAADAAEVSNAFTYGGATLAQYPLAIYQRDLVVGVTFVLPLAFINWYPVLFILGRPDPLGLPSVLRYLAPAVALLAVALTAAAWRGALRRYTSTGS